VDNPLGLTIPFNVAVVEVILVAEAVVVVGAEPLLRHEIPNP